MTWKQIETSREVRLWVGQIVVPIVTTVGAMMMVPEVRTTIIDKSSELKSRVKAKFKK